ncbi:MAG: hypothetical protein GY941_07895 [Planctomycetes bacterium]|nr:hypothetical protein [Planctomycetota bacterium]
MSTGIILNEVLNDDHRTTASSNLCKRVLYRKSSCTLCVGVCPQDAISLNPGPTIKDGCTDCGLCQVVCPTEVFQNTFSSDSTILNKVVAVYENYTNLYSGDRKHLFFHCHCAEKQDRESVFLHCLGRITTNIILGAAFTGFDKSILTKGDCSRCQYERGEKLMEETIKNSRVLLECEGFAGFEVEIGENEKCRTGDLSRRDLFSKLADKIKISAASLVQSTESTIREKLDYGVSGNRKKLPSTQMELLKILLRQRGHESIGSIKYNPELPVGKIKIDENACTACGACISLCPTGAISKTAENEYFTLYVNVSLCNNCALCKEACPQNAIDFDSDIAVSDILGEKDEVIARIKMASCTKCGGNITNGNSTLCPTCRKRYG